MPAASALRTQIENLLEGRFPSALSPLPRTIREVASTGIDPKSCNGTFWSIAYKALRSCALRSLGFMFLSMVE